MYHILMQRAHKVRSQFLSHTRHDSGLRAARSVFFSAPLCATRRRAARPCIVTASASEHVKGVMRAAAWTQPTCSASHVAPASAASLLHQPEPENRITPPPSAVNAACRTPRLPVRRPTYDARRFRSPGETKRSVVPRTAHKNFEDLDLPGHRTRAARQHGLSELPFCQIKLFREEDQTYSLQMWSQRRPSPRPPSWATRAGARLLASPGWSAREALQD